MKKNAKVMAWALWDNEEEVVVLKPDERFPLLFNSRREAYEERQVWESVVRVEIRMKARKKK